MSAFDNMRCLLASCTLEAVAHKREQTMKTVKTDVAVAEALKIMAAANVLSLPVVDATTGQFAGVFSVNDALRHLIKEINLDKSYHEVADEAEVVNAMQSLTKKTVESLMHNGDLWYVRGQNPTVMDAVKDMLTDNTTHHRLFICETLKDTRPTGILSQSDIIQMMWDHKVEFGPLLQSTVEELGLCSAAAETVPANERTLQVLLNMFRDRKSCMGITAPSSGELIGNLSASDLRHVTPDLYPALMAPVGEFILRMNRLEVPSGPDVDWKAALAGVPVARVSPQDSLEKVLQLLTENHLHRLYVYDAVEGSYGIITLTDILRPLVPQPGSAPCEGPAGGLPAGEEEDMEVESSEMEPMQPHIKAT